MRERRAVADPADQRTREHLRHLGVRRERCACLPFASAMSFASSLNCTCPVVWKVNRLAAADRDARRGPGLVRLHGDRAGHRRRSRRLPVVPEVATAFSGRAITMRATSFEDDFTIAAVGPDRQAQRARAADVVQRAVDGLAVAQNDLRRAGEFRPVGVRHVAAGEVDHRDVVLRDVPFVAAHAHRVADAAEIDELAVHLLTGAQRQRCAVLRVGDARHEHGRGAKRAENRPLQHVLLASITTLYCRAFVIQGLDCKARAKLAYIIHGVQSTFLDNGLKILVQELHTAPLVSVWCWYRVGSGRRTAGADRRVALGRAHELQGHRRTSPATR